MGLGDYGSEPMKRYPNEPLKEPLRPYENTMAKMLRDTFEEQQRMSKDDVPEWALRRAVELAGFPVQVDDENKPLTWRYSLYNAGLDAFARYIAAHEKPPRDPLEQAVDDAFCLLPSMWDRESFVRCVTDTLRARSVIVATDIPSRGDE